MRRAVAIALPVSALSVLIVGAVLGGSVGDLIWIPLVTASTAVGSLLWYRRAGGAVGPLLAFVGLSIPVDVALSGYVHLATTEGLAGAGVAAWIFQSSIGLAGAIYLVLQLFPTGRPLTERWRILVWCTIGTIVLTVLAPAIGVTQDFTSNFPGVTHPMQITSPDVAESLVGIGGLVGVLVFLASAVEIGLRYRRSDGAERAQMKWFAAAGAVAAIGLAIGIFVLPQPSVAFALLTPLIPIATGIAILRYHLYDIDLVISKTVRYALLAAFISVVYVAIVVGASLVSGSSSSHLASIAATVVVAVLFQPVRKRAERIANRLVYGDRATPYEVMAGFSERVADTVSTDQVLPQMAEVAGAGVGAVEATVRVLLPGDTTRTERWTGRDVRAGEPWTVPIAYQGEPVGDLTVRKPVDDPLTPAERELLEDLGAQAGLALHNVRLTEELAIRVAELDRQAAALRVSRERLVTARDAQRRGLQRDIEDGPERQLIDIGRRLATITDPGGLDPLIERANETLEELRDLARGIFPPLLADAGIVPALEAHIRKVGAGTEIDAAPGFVQRRFDADVEACAYFCCLQAIQNISRHAGGAPSSARFATDGEELVFEVSDAGPGFEVATTPRGMGLQIIQDRVDALEGTLTVRSSPAGTTVAIRIPTHAHDLTGAVR